MSMEINVPEGWRIVNLNEIAYKITDGSHNPPRAVSKGVPMLSAKDIRNNCISFDTPRLISEDDFVIENKRAQIAANDILLTIVATIGRTAVVPPNKTPFTLQRSVATIKTNANSHFLCYYFQSKFFQKQLTDSAKGTAQKGVYLKTLSQLKIILPEFKEQQLIVEKIEELFSELDKGIENLKIAQQQLKVYRQAVLKWAFEGKLTNENVKDGVLPEGWKGEKLGVLIEKPKYGTSKKCDYNSVGKAVLRIPNILNGLVNSEDLKYAEFDKAEIETYKLKEGDLLIIRSNGSVNIVGQTALITKKDEDYLYAGYLICLRPFKNLIDSKYLAHALSSSNLRNQIEEKARSTSGVNNINTDEIRGLLITTCSTDEQKKVVQEIESRLSVCDKMEETIINSLQQAEALRQSILKRAFEGKLVKAEIPQSVYKPKNVYFYQMQVLGMIASASKEKGINHGEMTIAKYAYLLDKIYQVPTYYNYQRWHLGPYPPEIKKAINNAKFFNKTNNNIEVKDFETLTRYTNPYTDKLKNAIDDLTNIFSSYPIKERSYQTELVATVCKVIEDIQTIDFEVIRKSMAEWLIDLPTTHFKNKAEKFDDEDTKKCVNQIMEKGWYKVLVKS